MVLALLSVKMVLVALAEAGVLQDVVIYRGEHGDGMQPVPQGAPSLSGS